MTTTDTDNTTRARIAQSLGYATAQIPHDPTTAARNLADIHRTHGLRGAATAALLATRRALADGHPLPEPDDPTTTHLLHALCRAHGTAPPLSAFATLLAAHRHADRIRTHLAHDQDHRAHLTHHRHASTSPRGALALTALTAASAASAALPARPPLPHPRRALVDHLGFER